MGSEHLGHWLGTTKEGGEGDCLIQDTGAATWPPSEAEIPRRSWLLHLCVEQDLGGLLILLSLCEALNLPTGRVKGSALFHHSLSELCRSRPSACWLVMPDSFNWESLSRHAVGADVNRECAWLDLHPGAKAQGDPDPSSPCAHAGTDCGLWAGGWAGASPGSEEGEGGEEAWLFSLQPLDRVYSISKIKTTSPLTQVHKS